MAENSQLSRSRLAVLAISGFAAAYGIYTIFQTFSYAPSNKTALHRSNAVHRQRPSRPMRRRSSGTRSSFHIIDYTKPDQDAPLGRLLIHHPESHMVMTRNIAQEALPVMLELEQFMDELAHEAALEHEVLLKAIECILYASIMSYESPQHQVRAHFRLEGLPQAIAAGDLEEMHEYIPAMSVILSVPVTSADMDEAVTRLLDSGNLPTRDSADRDTDAMTHAETEPPESRDAAGASSQEPTQGLKGLLYHIAESDAKRKAYLHRGIHCEDCGERPIRGIRWHCLNCADFDLCSTCEMHTAHPKTHVFAKIQIPLPRISQPTQESSLWYPGDPTKVHGPLSADVKKRLGDLYNFDDPHMDAHYDQFCCIANIPWPNDHLRVMAGIDRRAFNKALTSERWPRRFRPNALYDRMFAFYDTNGDGIIGFEEFVSGLAYLRGQHRFGSLRRALQGFDIDNDGYVSREDFLRLLRAKYEIQQLIIGDMVEAQEKEHSRIAMDTLRSSQPISSVFNNDEIPPGEIRVPDGKRADVFHDMQPEVGTNTILDDEEAWPKEQPIRVVRVSGERGAQSHEGLQGHLSRFEELLSSPSDKGDTTVPIADEDDDDKSLDQDIIWEVIEQGFNELLDGLFKAKESWDQEVVDTRQEREIWRKEIDEVAKERENLKEQWKSASEVDPLIATAYESHANTNGNPASLTPIVSQSFVTRPMVPTDTASLEERESEIAQQSLDELLDSTGYSVVTDATTPSAHEFSTSEESHADSTAEETGSDSTMPQHRPDSASSFIRPPSEEMMSLAEALEYDQAVREGKAQPTRAHLEELSRFDEHDREIRLRGGPGILSYEEIEELAQADETKELRGLITSWLELASF